MNHVSALRERYEAVMRQFEEADEQERDQSDRLLRAITDIGDWLSQQRALTAEYRRKNEQLSDENEQLRFMLHSLLVGIESRNRGTMTKAMMEVESRLSSLMKNADIAEHKQLQHSPAALETTDDGSQGAAPANESTRLVASGGGEDGDEGLAIPDDRFSHPGAGQGAAAVDSGTVADDYAPFPVNAASSAPKPPPFPYADAANAKK